MKSSPLFLALACTACLLPSLARAESITTFTTSVTGANSKELGRPSRNSIPQDWAGDESFPGTINTGTTYYYATYTLPAADFLGAPAVEITDFEPLNTSVYFLSAYANSYNPANRLTNWLGDAGYSGNYLPFDGGDFQVALPTGDNLVLVLNNTGGGIAGLGTPVQITVSAYADSDYTEPTAPQPAMTRAVTPEPASLLLLSTGATGLLTAARRQRRTSF